MPENHKLYSEWNSERFLHWAGNIGSSTREVIEKIFTSYRVEEQAYRGCLSLSEKRRLDFTLITFAIYQILLLYFNFLIDSLSDSIFICSIAIAFNFSNLSDWLMPSFINTALRFSRLERQTSCDISA